MSFLWLTILSALRILRRNPLRAGLTMLGIIIGIGAVVAMVSLGQGATASVQAEISSLGTNVMIVIPGATTVGGVRGGLGTVSTLTVDDALDDEVVAAHAGPAPPRRLDPLRIVLRRVGELLHRQGRRGVPAADRPPRGWTGALRDLSAARPPALANELAARDGHEP